jgi:hypothetical protein
MDFGLSRFHLCNALLSTLGLYFNSIPLHVHEGRYNMLRSLHTVLDAINTLSIFTCETGQRYC